MTEPGTVIEINGPLVRARLPGIASGEQVRLGKQKLTGEVIGLDDDRALIQVYESTEMLRPGETVIPLGYPLSVELGPGLLGGIFDGIQRPLTNLREQAGDYIPRGLDVPALERDRPWAFIPNPDLKAGQEIRGGMVLGTVQETASTEHRILTPPGVHGELLELAAAGEYDLKQVIARVHTPLNGIQDLKLFHRWPVRIPRPYQKRDDGVAPLLTGQRILDTFFPLLKGGKGAIPGPFGAGKTMLQQQIARWTNADIVIYVGCGERGNELVDILDSFPELTDPYSGRSLMERTLLVANTSNMPVVAREASIYLGVTLAEYYRDQGHDVVMLADSTSRWAEALREVAGRLGQMPVEEGYPAYLASRLASFYERAGRVETLSGESGSVSLIGAVSPPGGDFSEPVTNHTKDIIQTFWALSKPLADARHYPSVSWTESFSDAVEAAARWWSENVDESWQEKRSLALNLLSRAEELARIINLVGAEALSPIQRWTVEMASLLREGLLQQNALDEVDSYCSPQKQFALLDLMIGLYQQGQALVKADVPVSALLALPLLSRARRSKNLYGNDQLDELHALGEEFRSQLEKLRQEYEEQNS
ncbi:MAG TPA: V-type ATP synthase subunit A [Thiolapillus brandeum]|uniref:V-type ATP synthase alpha chain n=1 Tax=Thiolapillus brandeum TaxID=1076588 RepID=A0A831RWP3_9GAMM|nr:V-type ATP synthase subunit A [Thiolapillus brandeum]